MLSPWPTRSARTAGSTERSAPYVASWLDEPETFKATMTGIHNRATSLMDALDAAMSGSDGTPKVVTIKPTWVVDVSQTDERAPRAAASRPAGWT